MRYLWWIAILMSSQSLFGQGFECDGSFYMVVYTRSIGISTLYIARPSGESFQYEEIRLSENRRLNALSYNVLDKYLYALDADTYELVRISRNGDLLSMGVPENIDRDLIYNGATVSPDGAGIYLLAYDEEMGNDIRFYTINLSRTNLYAGYLGVTGERPVSVHDFATDPITGVMYGYDNLEGTLTQIGIGGGVAALKYPTTGVRTIDGLFFDQEGELFAFSARDGMYSINKRTGTMRFIEKGPEGSLGDGCSCPYTYSFEKTVDPPIVVECGEFEVIYSYRNHLGIGQTWLDFRDTFPEGFEILDIESNILTPSNVVASPPNILALENIIYVMNQNEIRIKVKSPPGYTGTFSSQAVQWDFPLAFDTVQYSDDPTTNIKNDPTWAEVVAVEEISIDAELTFSCDGSSASIGSPITADEYLWSTGSTESFIEVDRSGVYTLRASNECVVFTDSISITQFPESKMASIQGDREVVLGNTGHYQIETNMDGPLDITWTVGDSSITCECPTFEFVPPGDIKVEVMVVDRQGCMDFDDFDVRSVNIRHTYSPNAFSPNNDGINDHFFIQSSTDGIIRSLMVFNRWGNAVYNGTNIPLNSEEAGWDGRINSRTLPTGLYIWMADIQYFDGYEEVLHGEIVLIGQ